MDYQILSQTKTTSKVLAAYARKGELIKFLNYFASADLDPRHVGAETAEMAKEIDVERARLAAEKAKKELSKAATPQDMAAAQAALRRALIRLRVSEGLSKRLHKR